MGAAASGLVVKDDEARPRLQVVAAVGPEIGFPGFAAARFQLRHGRFVGEQGVALEQVPLQPFRQGLQSHADPPDPFRQG